MKKILIIIPIFVFSAGLMVGVFSNPTNFRFGTEKCLEEISVLGLFLHNIKAILSNVAGVLTMGISTCINIFMTAFMLGINIKIAMVFGSGEKSRVEPGGKSQFLTNEKNQNYPNQTSLLE